MTYGQKFKGDLISEMDLLPITLEGLLLEVPEPLPRPSRLRDLPIRVKTRFRGGKSSARRRVVSTPIFDLVTPIPCGDEAPLTPTLEEPETASNKPFVTSSRALPSLPSMAERHVSLPLLDAHRSSRESLASNTSNSTCANIIQVYSDHSPFTQPLKAGCSREEGSDITSSDSSSEDFSIVDEISTLLSSLDSPLHQTTDYSNEYALLLGNPYGDQKGIYHQRAMSHDGRRLSHHRQHISQDTTADFKAYMDGLAAERPTAPSQEVCIDSGVVFETKPKVRSTWDV